MDTLTSYKWISLSSLFSGEDFLISYYSAVSDIHYLIVFVAGVVFTGTGLDTAAPTWVFNRPTEGAESQATLSLTVIFVSIIYRKLKYRSTEKNITRWLAFEQHACSASAFNLHDALSHYVSLSHSHSLILIFILTLFLSLTTILIYFVNFLRNSKLCVESWQICIGWWKLCFCCCIKGWR